MERIDHVNVSEVCRCCFISNIYWVLQRDGPDRECLELGVACLDAALILMIELGKTCSHLSRTGTRSRYDNELSGRLDIIILTVTVFTYDKRNVGRISCDRIVSVRLNAEASESCFELLGQRLASKLGNYNASYKESELGESIDQAENFLVIGNSQVSSSLILLNGISIDRDNDLGIFRKGLQHSDLAVRFEARQYS